MKKGGKTAPPACHDVGMRGRCELELWPAVANMTTPGLTPYTKKNYKSPAPIQLFLRQYVGTGSKASAVFVESHLLFVSVWANG